MLSASFIPVYARLLAEGDEEEAGRVAGAVLALLSLVTAVIVLLGVFAAPLLIYVIAPGFHGAQRELTIRLVRILFPGAGLLVVSAWCLGILNSHRKFFLSYTAPVLWNVAIITALVAFRHQPQNRLAVTLAWGFVVGSALQIRNPVAGGAAPHAPAPQPGHGRSPGTRGGRAISGRCSSAAAWSRSAPGSTTSWPPW